MLSDENKGDINLFEIDNGEIGCERLSSLNDLNVCNCWLDDEVEDDDDDDVDEQDELEGDGHCSLALDGDVVRVASELIKCCGENCCLIELLLFESSGAVWLKFRGGGIFASWEPAELIVSKYW